jgi:hypothetical protein
LLRRLSDRTRVRVNLLRSRGLPIGLVTVVVGGYRANHWIYWVGAASRRRHRVGPLHRSLSQEARGAAASRMNQGDR